MTTITLPRATVEQALEALGSSQYPQPRQMAAITNLRAALAQQFEPVQEQAEPVQPGAWVASKDGRVIYDYVSTDDCLLRVSGDFENDEQRFHYAKQIVDKLNAAPPQRKLVPLTEEEIYHATGHFGVSEYTAINIARVIEEESWKKNHGQA